MSNGPVQDLYGLQGKLSSLNTAISYLIYAPTYIVQSHVIQQVSPPSLYSRIASQIVRLNEMLSLDARGERWLYSSTGIFC